MPNASIYFQLIAAAAILLFGLGLLENILFWLSGDIQRDRKATAGEKAGYVLGGAAAFFRVNSLRAVLLDAALQRRVLRESFLRWLMHVSLSWSFVELFLVGSVGLMLAEKGVIPLTKDTPWFALVNDFFGLLMLLGAAIAVCRRYVLKVPQLKTVAADGIFMAAMGLLVISGYLLEATRLSLERGLDSLSAYSFVGYGLARALGSLPIFTWPVHWTLWWFHIAAGFTLVAYLPYSRIFHLFASPMVVAMAAQRDRQCQDVSMKRESNAGLS